jgi:ammonia channel protein AmtB
MVNTIIAPSAAGITSFFTRKYITGQNHEYRLDFAAIGNGILAGAVSITAGCADVEPWAALIIGIIGSFVYSFACLLLEKLEVDDPVEATQVHGFSGFWGCIALGLFHTEKGLLYGGGGKLIGANALGCLCIALWTASISFMYFFTLNKLGVLRLSVSDELLGGDVHYFAPIKFQGKVSEYTKGLALTRLNTSHLRSPTVIPKDPLDDILEDGDDNQAPNEEAKPNILKNNEPNAAKLAQVTNGNTEG